MTGRLDKIISSCCLLSRTEAQTALKAGRVTVDGEIVRQGAVKADSQVQCILLDGQRVDGDGYVYLMLYKPVGVLSATEDRKGAVTALDLLPERYRKASPGVVGRLDKDAEGLLFLTSNGALNHRLTAPRHHADKVYLVTLDRPATAMDVLAFSQPMDLGDFITQPASLTLLQDGRMCRVTLHEGKFHQIKRMFAHQGKTVLTLKRLSIGTLTLDESLAPGQWRPLHPEEIQQLLTLADTLPKKQM